MYTEPPERVNAAISGAFLSLLCQNIAYFIFELKLLFLPQGEKVLKDRLVVAPKFPVLSLSLQ